MSIHPRERANRRWLVGLGLVLLGVLGGWGLGSLAQAGELATVCPAGPPTCSFTTVQEAVAAVSSGATVLVEAGEYAGPVIISKALTLIGAGPGFVTVTRGVIVAGPFPVTIKGLTITQGLNGLQAQAPPGLPAQYSPVVVVENVTIAGNATNGIALFDASRAILSNVTVTQNGISILGNPVGSGIALRGQASLVTAGPVVVRENGANGISLLDESSAQIGPGTFIARNGLSGVQLGGQAQATFTDIISRENGCYGIAVEDNASAQITGGRLESNAKAGLHVGGPSSTISGCQTLLDTPGYAAATVEGTVIAGNAIGVLVGDLSKERDQGAVNLAMVTFLGNGCDLLVDPAYPADSVVAESTFYTSCQ